MKFFKEVDYQRLRYFERKEATLELANKDLVQAIFHLDDDRYLRDKAIHLNNEVLSEIGLTKLHIAYAEENVRALEELEYLIWPIRKMVLLWRRLTRGRKE